jgi:hypothetical protein
MGCLSEGYLSEGYLSELHAWYVAEYGPDAEVESPAPEPEQCPTCGRPSADPLTGACERVACARDAAARVASRGALPLVLPGDSPEATTSR